MEDQIRAERQRRAYGDVVADQLRAMDAFHRSRARAAAEQAAESRRMTGQMRMDLARRRDVLRRQHEALVRRTDEQLRASCDLLYSSIDRRAVVAHADPWFFGRLARRLEEQGVRVLARVDCGAQAVGVAVAEQADVLLVGDRLQRVCAQDVVRQLKPLAPHTVLAAQAPDADAIPSLLDAGAEAVFSRRLPPEEVADELARLVVV